MSCPLFCNSGPCRPISSRCAILHDLLPYRERLAEELAYTKVDYIAEYIAGREQNRPEQRDNKGPVLVQSSLACLDARCLANELRVRPEIDRIA